MVSAARVACLSLILAVGAVAVAPAPAAAQTGQIDLQPPIPTPPRESKGNVVQIGVMILLAGIVLTASLIPSKRGHQD